MTYIVRCLICDEAKPIVDETIEDARRYGPCMSTQCVALRLLEFDDKPLFNIAWLKQSNADKTTAREMRDEIYEDARRDGRDITRAR